MFKKRKSFTLVELLMVIAIIGILSAVVIVNVSQARLAARDSQRIADLASIQLALEKYKSANGHYPITCQPATGTDPCSACDGDINTRYGKWFLWAESASSGYEWGTQSTSGCPAGSDAGPTKAVWGTPIGNVTNSLGKYLTPFPTPPLNGSATVQVVKGVGGFCSSKGSYGSAYPMSYLYRSDNVGQNYKLMTYLESRCNGINTNDGGLYPQYYEVFNSSLGQALTE